MKIQTLRLIAFGPFTGVDLALADDATPRLHLILGPNEAGKRLRTTRRRPVLVRVSATVSRRCVFPQVRQTSRWCDRGESAGETLTAVRRKAKDGTLRDATDQVVLRDDALTPFLGRVTEEQFATLWGIDHIELRRGGEDILAGQGEIGQLLFATGSGLAGLSAVRDQLVKKAEELFVARGHKRKINLTMDQLIGLAKKRDERSLSSDTWVSLNRALTDAQHQLATVRSDHTEAMKALRHVEKLLESVQKYTEFMRLSEQLKTLQDAPLLPADFDGRRTLQVKERAIAQSQLKTITQRCDELEKKLTTLVIPIHLLTARKHVDDLAENWGRIKEARATLPIDEGRLDQLRLDVDKCKARLADFDPAAMNLRPTLKLQTEIDDLASEGEKLDTAIATTQDRLAKLQKEQVDQQPTESTPLPDLEPLKELRAMLTAAERDANELDATKKNVADVDAEVAAALTQLRGWHGTADDLERWAPPSQETLDRFQDHFDDLKKRYDRRRDDLNAIEQDLAKQLAARDVLLQTRAPPTEAMLVQARGQRDAHLTEVLQAWQHAAAFDAAVAHRVTAAVAAADHVADRLKREAQQAAHFVQLQADLDRLEAERKRLKVELEQGEAMKAQTNADWAAQWSGVALDSRSPREMAAWLNQRDAIIRLLKERRRLESEARSLQLRLAEVEINGNAVCVSLGIEPRQSNESLARWSERLKKLEVSLQRRAQQHAEATALAAKTKADCAQAEWELEQSRKKQEAWQQRWSAAVTRVGLPASIQPGVARKVLSELLHLQQKVDEVEALQAKRTTSEQAIAQFESDVRNLAHTVGLAMDVPVDDLLAELRRRATDAEDAEKERARLQKELASAQKDWTDWKAKLAAAEATLAELCREAGAAHEEELTECLERSQRRRQGMDRVEALRIDLAAAAMTIGIEPDAFLAELAAVGGRDLLGEQQAAEAEIQELQRQLDDLNRRIGEKQNELDRLDGAGTAADLEAERCATSALLERQIVEYQRAQLATLLLDEAMARHRKAHQGPVLRRTGDLFAQLTLGSFTGIDVRPDEKAHRDCLYGIRGDSAVPVGGMSEGTRDQLYLALRLASLETYLDQHEPMPFIVDDILVHFDDARAEAALRALAELSRRTQVLFFTHHQHLIDLAQRCLPQEQTKFHDLAKTSAL